MIGFNEHQVDMKKVGIKVLVPNDPISKLMHYLHCIDSTNNLNIEPKLHDISKRHQLSFEDENKVLYYASIYNPSIFKEKSIFNKPYMCDNKDNMFYNITDVRITFQIAQDITILGKTVHTSKIMVYKNRWLIENYYNSIKLYQKRIDAIKNGTVESFRPKKQSYTALHKQRPQSVQKSNHNYNQGNNHCNKPKTPFNPNKNAGSNNYHKPHANNNYNQKSNNHYDGNNHKQPHCFHQRPQSVQRQKNSNNHCNFNRRCQMNININIHHLPQNGYIKKKTYYDTHNQKSKNQKDQTRDEVTIEEQNKSNSQHNDESDSEIYRENESNQHKERISDSLNDARLKINDKQSSENQNKKKPAINAKQSPKKQDESNNKIIDQIKPIAQLLCNDKNMTPSSKDDSSTKPSNTNTLNQNNSNACLLI